MDARGVEHTLCSLVGLYKLLTADTRMNVLLHVKMVGFCISSSGWISVMELFQ